jgi:hypothetical protein
MIYSLTFVSFWCIVSQLIAPTTGITPPIQPTKGPTMPEGRMSIGDAFHFAFNRPGFNEGALKRGKAKKKEKIWPKIATGIIIFNLAIVVCALMVTVYYTGKTTMLRSYISLVYMDPVWTGANPAAPMAYKTRKAADKALWHYGNEAFLAEHLPPQVIRFEYTAFDPDYFVNVPIALERVGDHQAAVKAAKRSAVILARDYPGYVNGDTSPTMGWPVFAQLLEEE